MYMALIKFKQLSYIVSALVLPYLNSWLSVYTADLDLGPFSLCMLEFSLMRLINGASLSGWRNSCLVSERTTLKKKHLPLWQLESLKKKILLFFFYSSKNAFPALMLPLSKTALCPLFSACQSDWQKRQNIEWNRVTVYAETFNQSSPLVHWSNCMS